MSSQFLIDAPFDVLSEYCSLIGKNSFFYILTTACKSIHRSEVGIFGTCLISFAEKTLVHMSRSYDVKSLNITLKVAYL